MTRCPRQLPIWLLPPRAGQTRVSDDFASNVAGVGALAEPASHPYLFVAAQPESVSREEAASACDMSPHTARFHLDRLVDQGLLDVEFRRLTGRTGPGAGRTAKLYRRSEREVSVLPARSYDLAGDILAEAIDRSVHEDRSVGESVAVVAEERGRSMAADEVPPGEEIDRVAHLLERHGYEPRASPDGQVDPAGVIATAISPTFGGGTVLGFDLLRERDAIRARVELVGHQTRLYDDLTATENLRFACDLHGLDPGGVGARARAGRPDRGGGRAGRQLLPGHAAAAGAGPLPGAGAAADAARRAVRGAGPGRPGRGRRPAGRGQAAAGRCRGQPAADRGSAARAAGLRPPDAW